MEEREERRGGCARGGLVAGMLVWLAVVPAVAAVLASAPLAMAQGLQVAITLGVAALLLLPPYAIVALSAWRRPEWSAVSATAVASLTVAGYVLLDAALRAALPDAAHALSAARLIVLSAYALLAARLAPRAVVTPEGKRPSSPLPWRCSAGACALSLALAALLTLPWPLTGALGDLLASLGILLEALADVVPALLLVWGVAFPLLTTTYRHTEVAALATILLYLALVAGRVLPTDDWGALGRALVLLPLALLLTELRARDGLLALFPVALPYVAFPSLFTDPRDALGTGIPEPQHLLAQALIWGTALFLALLLFALRKRLRRPLLAGRPALVTAALLWGLWIAAYLLLGKPGFYNDGFLIIMEEQADLSAAYAIPDREARLAAVYEALVEKAERTQAPLWAELEERGLPYRPYYVQNMIRVDGHSWLMSDFAGEPGVERVILNPNVREYPWRLPLPAGEVVEEVTELPGNLVAVDVEGAWELGARGEGIVVGGQDTGYDWTHPALRPHYRGWDGESAHHDYNWHDAWDESAEPFDDGSHGTHTMGTVLGDDAEGARVGVAPGAEWIGCRNMRRGLGNPASYAECMEFLLAPYPLGGDPFTEGDVSRAPHVINNSWGCPSWEGCHEGTLRPATEALRAAGIMMVVSAGNDGPACDSVDHPPANYDAVFSVGATTDAGLVTGFSSRGPAEELVKPDVSAPGFRVLSSVPEGGYAYSGGTSMASPHVAGLVALLWSANPDLVGDVDATERLICATATPRPVESACAPEPDETGDLTAIVENPVCACGEAEGIPNNVYGCGIIDVDAAIEAALE